MGIHQLTVLYVGWHKALTLVFGDGETSVFDANVRPKNAQSMPCGIFWTYINNGSCSALTVLYDFITIYVQSLLGGGQAS